MDFEVYALKIAIIGAGPGGLACAMECERLGVQAELFEKDSDVGWIWSSVSFWPNLFYNSYGKRDARDYVKTEYGIDFTVLNNTKSLLLKSASKQATVKGTLGLTVARGKADESLENQLLNHLNQTPVYYNYLADYAAMAKEYDYVVVATGREIEARSMGLWHDKGKVVTIGSVAAGNFDINSSVIYFNTEYAGTGYGRLTPFNQHLAVIELNIIGLPELQALTHFERFIKTENLDRLDYLYKNMPPVFSMGKVTKFQKDNVLLAGRAAGLTDRLLGAGAVEALISGTMAARAIARKKDYNSMVKPLQKHVEDLSAFRNIVNGYGNTDFDRTISILGAPLIKQAVYNSRIDFIGMAGHVLASKSSE